MTSERFRCEMVAQGYKMGSCQVEKPDGTQALACQTTLRKSSDGNHERLIKSTLLSRPEDYFSIYQSGCNHSCLKCHSHEFSKVATGIWRSTDQIAQLTSKYRDLVTVMEPREAATSWHAHRLCRHCGRCLMTGKPAESCPRVLDPEQVLLSPQGFGPARNIVAFTGGDVMCKPEFYVEVTKKIKEESEDLWVLLETNGYGLTPKNLEEFAAAGVDSFWLDIKAFYEETYQSLCGTSNSHILDSVGRIVDLGFTLEILTLYIPSIVESEEHAKIAELIANVDSEIPTTLLAFFPCYQLLEPEYRAPTVQDMTISFLMMTNQGLKNLRLGNLGVFLKNEKDVEFLLNTLGPEVL